MAIHALWEDRYGLSVRKAAVDLSDLTSTASFLTASHTNVGVASNEGKKHFGNQPTTYDLKTALTSASETEVVVDAVIANIPSTGFLIIALDSGAILNIAYTAAAVSVPNSDTTFTIASTDFSSDNASANKNVVVDNIIGQPTSKSGTVATGKIFGLPVTGNPGIAINQETIEVQKTDGFATQRVGGANEASDIFRAGQNPSASFDFVTTGKALVQTAALFFQNGLKEVQYDLDRKVAKLPSNTDGAEPSYWGTFVRKISSDSANSHLLSDSVASSLSFSLSQTAPLSISTTLQGRLMNHDANVSTLNDNFAGNKTATAKEAQIFGLDGKRNYLLQDSIIAFEASDGSEVVMAVEALDLTLSAEVTPNRFNTFFPLNMVLGNYTVEGSFTIPMLGKGSNSSLDYDYFCSLMADAGGSGTGASSAYDPKLLSVNWATTDSTYLNAKTAGQTVAFKDTTLATALSSATTTSVVVVGDYTSLGTTPVFEITKDSGVITTLVATNTSFGGGNTTFTIASTDFSGADAAAIGSKIRIATKTAMDLSLRASCVITDVSVGGSTEATMTVSFRCMNKFTAGTDTIVKDAFYMEFRDDQDGAAWGFNTI